MCVALPTKETSFILITNTLKTCYGETNSFKDFGLPQERYILFVDSQIVINHGKNLTFFSFKI